jgi:hypothetical protein
VGVLLQCFRIVGESLDKEKRVARIVRVGAALVLVCGMLSGVSRAGTVWDISAPYPDNPLKLASLEGQGKIGRVSFPVSLELSCHPGVTVARAVLRLPLHAGGWDLSQFYGTADGKGQRLRTFSLLGTNRRVIDRPRFSATAGDNGSTQLSWVPNDTLLSRLLRPGDGVQLRLSALRRTQGNLDVRFVFPADAKPMLDALAPCSKTLQQKGKTADGK